MGLDTLVSGCASKSERLTKQKERCLPRRERLQWELAHDHCFPIKQCPLKQSTICRKWRADALRRPWW